MKKFLIDLETTGLNPYKNGIWQFAGILLDHDNELIKTMNHKIIPFERAEYEEEAIKMAGYESEERMKFDLEEVGIHENIFFSLFVSLIDSHVDKYDKLDKMAFIGYNSSFDDKFMRALFRRNAGHKTYFGSYFWWPPLDVGQLFGWNSLNFEVQVTDRKLTTVAKALAFKFNESDSHDALFDIKLTLKIAQYFGYLNPKEAKS